GCWRTPAAGLPRHARPAEPERTGGRREGRPPSGDPALGPRLRADALLVAEHPVRVEHVLRARSLIEGPVALWCLVERDHGGVHGLGDLAALVEDRVHQLAVVAHHRALAGSERVRLGPAEPDSDREAALLGRFVLGARVAGHVQADDAELT